MMAKRSENMEKAEYSRNDFENYENPPIVISLSIQSKT